MTSRKRLETLNFYSAKLKTRVLKMCKNDDFAWIRGANYVPSYAVNDVQLWLNYNHKIVDRELGYAERIKCNSVRVFLQQLVYEHNPEGFLENLSDFVDLCDKHCIRPMLVLFDSCFGVSPSLENNMIWVANPGPDHMGKDFWPQSEKYARDVVKLFDGDERMLIWDVMNEPTATWLAITPEGRKLIWDFCRHFCEYVKSLDGSHPITVGVAGTDNSEVINHVDVLSMHCYASTKEAFLKAIQDTRRQAEEAGKPFIVSECCAPGWGCHYEMVLPLLRREKIGYYFSELMIGKWQFRTVVGLFYPDGTVRRLSRISAVLGKPAEGFIEKPEKEGVPIVNVPIEQAYRDILNPLKHGRFAKYLKRRPTTRLNFSERFTALQSLAIMRGSEEINNKLKIVKAFYEDRKFEKAFKEVDDLLHRIVEDTKHP